MLSRVRRAKKDETTNPFLDRAIESKLRIDDFEATLYKFGTGPKKVLFLHGWKSHSARWEAVVELLDLEEFTCYALDAPAHGRSAGNAIHLEIYRKFVVEVIEDVGGLHCIVAHSLGGLVTAYAFMCDPKIPVDRFIITGAPAGMQSIYDFFQRIIGVNEAVMTNMDSYISKSVMHISAPQITMENLFRVVKRPTLVIHDEDDRICPITPIREGVANNPEIETLFTSGLGHDLQSVEVYRKIGEFLEALSDSK